jgi:hypothetical protein
MWSKMRKTKCIKCNNDFTNNNFKKHFEACDGSYSDPKSRTHCNYCKRSWGELGLGVVSGDIANHSRWCSENPKRQEYVNKLIERCTDEVGMTNVAYMNEAKRKSGITNQYVKAKMEGRSIVNPLKGKPHPNPIKNHKPETIEVIRQKALKSNHRRLRKGMVEYNGIMLDSSWELALAQRLDELGIKWVRPESMKWVDDKGNEHNYFSDFHLTDYDLYLDPKNPAAYTSQLEKIEVLLKTYPNLIFLKTLKECREFNIEA